MIVCLVVAAARTAAEEPWYVDDEKLASDFSAKLIDLAKQGKCLRSEAIQKKLAHGKCKLTLKKPSDRVLTPEEVYQRALASVLVLGSVTQSADHPGQWEEGRLATAWVLTEDGVLATNWHVFDKLGKECYGAVNAKGEVFPVIDVLGSDPVADIALVRVAGKGFTPLPLATDAKVGAWVAVLSHPANQFFTFTQGHVTRYTKNLNSNGTTEKWMSITADFAYGSSGGPVLNRCGAVVGMATVTSNVDYPLEELPEEKAPAEKPQDGKAAPRPASKEKPAAEKPPEKEDNQPKKAAPEGSLVQMIVKLAVPARTIEAFCTEGKSAPAEK